MKRLLKSIAVAASIALCICVATTARAHAAACGMRKDMVAYLTKRYQEHPRAVGLVSRNSIMEIMVSKKGTWSILVTMTDGRTCIVAAGQDWGEIKMPQKLILGDPT